MHRSRIHEQVIIYIPPDEDDPEHTMRQIRLPPHFPYLKLHALGKILEAEGLFVTGYIPPRVGACNPDGFIYEKQFDSIQTILLPDRNIVSRMAQIADGAPMNETLRKVAAIKAFTHFLDIQIEPSVAFHELAHQQGNEAANLELARFRDADNADPQPWLDLAFGDQNALAVIERTHKPLGLDLAFPLKRWRRNYIVALKIAELELSPRRNIDKMLDLLAWMRDGFIVAGPAAMLACIYFAPNSAPRKRLFKQLRSSERQRAIDGIRNATWDVTHLSEMIRNVNERAGERIRLMFASFDDGLRLLATLLIPSEGTANSETVLAQSLQPYWSKADAEKIAKVLTELYAGLHDENRKHRQTNSPFTIDQMIHDGEEHILSWSGANR